MREMWAGKRGGWLAGSVDSRPRGFPLRGNDGQVRGNDERGKRVVLRVVSGLLKIVLGLHKIVPGIT